MTSTSLSSRTMWLALLWILYHFCPIVQGQGLATCIVDETYRKQTDADIQVTCGTAIMDLSILICPVYFDGYNETLMALNAKYDKPECHGTPDWSVNPPVLRFKLPISEDGISACSSKMKITHQVGTGDFSDYSSVQYVNISGIINSVDPSAGTITYREEMMYIFSCRYPLQYLINNTQMSVSGVSIAINDNNGTFISTLSMQLYEDESYEQPLQMPDEGLKLKRRIFVEVKASNLTKKFNVLLDRCYATTRPIPSNSTYYDLFVGCNRDGQTVMAINGDEQKARFSFEAFRFVEHKDQTVSTFYLHCATRLCELSSCASLRPNCSAAVVPRRKRALETEEETSVSDVAMVSSGPITTQVDNGGHVAMASQAGTERGHQIIKGVSVAVGILGTLCVVLVLFIVYRIYSSKRRDEQKRPFN
ncbi:zona pellucida-like domain-containing protein 1 [Conger conger]|nr:zona pellucida-like domain-containing protein 1 [Conger conger]